MAWWESIDETRLLVAPVTEPSATGNRVGRLLSLRHPKSGNRTCYHLINGALQEIHWVKQLYGSWFLGDYVCEDGRLYTATPVDPVFIMLPIFEEARMKKADDPGMFRQLDEIIFIEGYPGYQYLFSIAEKSMQVVCDFKEIGSTKFFRLNDSKVLAWLNYKVNQLKRTLPTLDKNYAARDDEDTLADAVSLLGDYLKDDPWLKLLCSNLKLDLQAASTPDIEILTTTAEKSPVPFDPVQEKGGGSDKKTARSGRQTKKAKVETDSRNIKDMFRRASRRG
ncbi:Ribonuclease H2 subunit B like [Actinidia chinensis var. chinensis]|uniref:Ribonuclease H2 subunit B n=1 Tax=Actinidia chinensis var. chinensis TaxID=1590841 RepID=A0A2R6QMA9_ACTCC|nr:Ribonuclease H2 subunit B like [Actinidia chinensis var. chinensis]